MASLSSDKPGPLFFIILTTEKVNEEIGIFIC